MRYLLPVMEATAACLGGRHSAALWLSGASEKTPSLH